MWRNWPIIIFEAARSGDGVDKAIFYVTRELAAGVGLGGYNRKAAAYAEQARVNLTKTLKAAVRKIAQHNAILGRYLATTIKTGTFCSYTPDPSHPVVWTL